MPNARLDNALGTIRSLASRGDNMANALITVFDEMLQEKKGGITARFASTGNVEDLDGLSSDGLDGTPVEGDIVLLKDQTDPKENGLWVTKTSGWERVKDDVGNVILGPNMTVPIREGSTLADKIYQVTSNSTVVGTDDITFEEVGTGGGGGGGGGGAPVLMMLGNTGKEGGLFSVPERLSEYRVLTNWGGGAIAFLPLTFGRVPSIRYFIDWDGNDDSVDMQLVIDQINADGSNAGGTTQFQSGQLGATAASGQVVGNLDLSSWDGAQFGNSKILRIQLSLSDLFTVANIRVGLVVDYRSSEQNGANGGNGHASMSLIPVGGLRNNYMSSGVRMPACRLTNFTFMVSSMGVTFSSPPNIYTTGVTGVSGGTDSFNFPNTNPTQMIINDTRIFTFNGLSDFDMTFTADLPAGSNAYVQCVGHCTVLPPL